MCALQGEGEQDLPVMIPGGALGAELLQPGGVRKKLKLDQAYKWKNTPQKNVFWSWGRDGKGLLGRLRKLVRNMQVTRPFALASWPSPGLPSNLLHAPLVLPPPHCCLGTLLDWTEPVLPLLSRNRPTAPLSS